MSARRGRGTWPGGQSPGQRLALCLMWEAPASAEPLAQTPDLSHHQVEFESHSSSLVLVVPSGTTSTEPRAFSHDSPPLWLLRSVPQSLCDLSARVCPRRARDFSKYPRDSSPLLFIFIVCFRVCGYICHVCESTQRGQKTVSDSLELKFQVIVDAAN